MKIVLQNKDLEYIYTHDKEKGSPKYPPEVVRGFLIKIAIIEQAENSQKLREFKSLRLEALKDDYKGYHSIRINKKYRIILKLVTEDDGTTKVEVVHIEDIVDYH